MQKVLVFLIVILTISGCSNNDFKKANDTTKRKTVKQEDTSEVKYVDQNHTQIGIYREVGNKLILLTDYNTSIKSGTDIGVFQIYPSNDKEISLDKKFGNIFYDKFVSLENHDNLKIGFNIKFTLKDGTNINHRILDPNTTIKDENIFTYLYDDYKNVNNTFYSHIEPSEYDDSTLFTSIKLYASSVENLDSDITLTVFTYDTEDDFDEYGNYRGNSSYSITITNN